MRVIFVISCLRRLPGEPEIGRSVEKPRFASRACDTRWPTKRPGSCRITTGAYASRRMTLEAESLALLEEVLPRLSAGFATLPPGSSPPVDHAAMLNVLNQVAGRLHQNYPYFHPLYAGQM